MSEPQQQDCAKFLLLRMKGRACFHDALLQFFVLRRTCWSAKLPCCLKLSLRAPTLFAWALHGGLGLGSWHSEPKTSAGSRVAFSRFGGKVAFVS